MRASGLITIPFGCGINRPPPNLTIQRNFSTGDDAPKKMTHDQLLMKPDRGYPAFITPVIDNGEWQAGASARDPRIAAESRDSNPEYRH
jgi:hypothetical protein